MGAVQPRKRNRKRPAESTAGGEVKVEAAPGTTQPTTTASGQAQVQPGHPPSEKEKEKAPASKKHKGSNANGNPNAQPKPSGVAVGEKKETSASAPQPQDEEMTDKPERPELNAPPKPPAADVTANVCPSDPQANAQDGKQEGGKPVEAKEKEMEKVQPKESERVSDTAANTEAKASEGVTL